MNKELLKQVSKFNWYHSIDFGNGVVTKGGTASGYFPAMRALKQLNINGADCLDIGTFDGLVAFEMERMGAKNVVATDLVDRPSFRFARDYFKSSVIYYPKAKLSNMEIIKSSGIELFDLVICSGILYHLYDPLTGVAHVRNLIKRNGLALFQTPIDKEDMDISLSFNVGGRFLVGTGNFWFPTKSALFYMLNYCCFNPLFFEMETKGSAPSLAVVAKAVIPEEVETADYWLKLMHAIGGKHDYMDFDKFRSDPISTKIETPDKLSDFRRTFPQYKPRRKRPVDDMVRKSYDFYIKLKVAHTEGHKKVIVYAPRKERSILAPVLNRKHIFKGMEVEGILTLDPKEKGTQYYHPKIQPREINGRHIVCIDDYRDDLINVGIQNK